MITLYTRLTRTFVSVRFHPSTQSNCLARGPCKQLRYLFQWRLTLRLYHSHSTTNQTPKMASNQKLDEERDPACFATIAGKKYFNIENKIFMKRTLRRSEWSTIGDGILIIPPTSYQARWENKAASLRYLSVHTKLPLPTLRGTFIDDGAFYFMTDYVEGVSLAELPSQDKAIVIREIEQHVAALRSLRSKTPGIPGRSLLCPPYRACAAGTLP